MGNNFDKDQIKQILIKIMYEKMLSPEQKTEYFIENCIKRKRKFSILPQLPFWQNFG